MTTSVSSNKRDRHGNAKATKRNNWHLITELRKAFDATDDIELRLKIGRLLVNAYAVHQKLNETVDLADEIKALKAQVGV